MHLEEEYYIISACCVGKMLGTFSLQWLPKSRVLHNNIWQSLGNFWGYKSYFHHFFIIISERQCLSRGLANRLCYNILFYLSFLRKKMVYLPRVV